MSYSNLFLDLHMQKNVPGLLFIVKKVVMVSTSQGLFLLAIVYTADQWLRSDHYT